MTVEDTASSTEEIRDYVVGKQVRFFDAAGVDEVFSMVFNLTSELWVTRQRLARLESLAESKGLWTADELEAQEFTDDQAKELEANRNAMIRHVYLVMREVATAESNPVSDEPQASGS